MVTLLLLVQGEMIPLLSGGQSVSLQTDAYGQFIVEEATAARFKFSSSYEGSRCTDSVTGVPITFPMIQDMPVVDGTAITAISLMIGPAKRDPEVVKRIPKAQADSLVPSYLWQHVYGLYGFDADALGVNFMSFTGDALKFSNPRSAQVLGNVAQTMSLYMSAYNMLGGLFGDKVGAGGASQGLGVTSQGLRGVAGHGVKG